MSLTLRPLPAARDDRRRSLPRCDRGQSVASPEPFWVEMNLHLPGKGYSLSVHTAHVEMQVYVSEAGRVVRAYEPRKKVRTAPDDDAPCGRMMVGSGTDTYDPTCDLMAGHAGPCKSRSAIDQHRLES